MKTAARPIRQYTPEQRTPAEAAQLAAQASYREVNPKNHEDAWDVAQAAAWKALVAHPVSRTWIPRQSNVAAAKAADAAEANWLYLN